ncbi:MAG: hypothetical protein ABJ370_15525 [Paracoccaceae bacterium]
MKTTVFLVSLSIAITGASVATADCPLRQKLRDDRRSLSPLVGVAARHRDFLHSYGVTLEVHGFGGTYAPRAALFAALETSGCDQKLSRWIKNKARHPRRVNDGR